MTVRVAGITTIPGRANQGTLHIVIAGHTLCGYPVVETDVSETAAIHDMTCGFCREEAQLFVTCLLDPSKIDRSPFTSRRRST